MSWRISEQLISPIMSERSRATDSAKSGSDEGVLVGTKRDLIEKKNFRCNVLGRDIVVFYHDRKFYAMDQLCYRKPIAFILSAVLLSSTREIAGKNYPFLQSVSRLPFLALFVLGPSILWKEACSIHTLDIYTGKLWIMYTSRSAILT